MNENIPSLKSRGPCRRCGQERVGENLAISRNRRSKDGYQYQCRACHNKISREGARRRYKHDTEYKAKKLSQISDWQKNRNRQFDKMIQALQSAYRLYVLEDDWKSQIEIDEKMYNALSDVMGDYNFVRWIDSIESGVPK